MTRFVSTSLLRYRTKRLASVLAGLLAAVASLAPISTARAQGYPSKPIRVVVPFPPGGATDIIARETTQRLASTHRWAFVVENRPGAGGGLGVDVVAKAAADGYTLLIGQTSNLAINPSLYTKLPYDPLKDLVPIASVATAPMVVVVPAASPYKSLSDLLAAAKAAPDTVRFASSGNGSLGHLTGQQLQTAAKVRLQHIPYKGASQALIDVISGTVDSYFTSVPSVRQPIRNGRLRALAVTASSRAVDLPEAPTMTEAGFVNFEASTWFGLLAPAGTPEAIIRTLSSAVNDALKQPELRARLAPEGATVTGGSPDQFMETIKSDITRWANLVRAAGARIE
ncbi:hypothetical protein CF68_29935 [Cupriavidus sp. SK-4]|uniref:Bug family tripartite tricarboxylate transporter substrate binding protein n=1 Tax=Cupriavidus sp. SK-4 TaxID=574750 RepID=UPI00044A7178|nr:tripartite tricarboxylate transporter substrate binding protein [Cupriavidus sp. SK-4]EYS91853.1 hypothetical protein CF68_29935 [Cupriavidus sp. SK-4]